VGSDPEGQGAGALFAQNKIHSIHDIPGPRGPGIYLTNQPPFSCPSPPSLSDWEEGGRGGFVLRSAFGSGVFAIATMESCRCFITGPLANSLRLATHTIGSHTDSTMADLLQARRAGIELTVAEASAG
jgi:hypothetical protein